MVMNMIKRRVKSLRQMEVVEEEIIFICDQGEGGSVKVRGQEGYFTSFHFSLGKNWQAPVWRMEWF